MDCSDDFSVVDGCHPHCTAYRQGKGISHPSPCSMHQIWLVAMVSHQHTDHQPTHALQVTTWMTHILNTWVCLTRYVPAESAIATCQPERQCAILDNFSSKYRTKLIPTVPPLSGLTDSEHHSSCYMILFLIPDTRFHRIVSVRPFCCFLFDFADRVSRHEVLPVHPGQSDRTEMWPLGWHEGLHASLSPKRKKQGKGQK